MNRLIVVIALLFSLASLGGPTMAHALSDGDVWIAATDVQAWCAEPVEADIRAPAYKPCAKKINGQAIPCQPLPAVLPDDVGCLLNRWEASYVPPVAPVAESNLLEGWFRPPRG